MFSSASGAKPYLYRAFGLVFSSEVELYGVPQANPQSVPLLRIRFGDISDSLPDAVDVGGFSAAQL